MNETHGQMKMAFYKKLSILLLSLLFLIAGVFHFTHTKTFILIMPPIIPYPKEIVYLTGILEIIGAIGILFRKTRKITGIFLAFFLVAIFPANIYMAIGNLKLTGIFNNQLFLWLRLPFQGLLIWWVLWSKE